MATIDRIRPEQRQLKVLKADAQRESVFHWVTFGVIASIASVALLVMGVPDILNGAASRNWPKVDGVIVTSVRHQKGQGQKKKAEAVIAYEYNVDQKTYTSEQLWYGPFQKSLDNLDRYPLGIKVPVHYKPGELQISVLEPGIRTAALVLGGSGALAGCVGIGLLGCAYLRRKRSLRASGNAEDGESEPPPDFILLLTPDQQIHERVQPAAFTEYVRATQLQLDRCYAELAGSVAETQVACAILPGGRLIIEVQTTPQESRSKCAQVITRRLRSLSVPNVTDQPVAFARRTRTGQPMLNSCLRWPFVSLLNHRSSTSLDDILLQSSGSLSVTPGARPSTAGDGFGRGVESVPAMIAKATELPVICNPQPLFCGGEDEPPFTVLEDNTATLGFASVRFATGSMGAVDALTLEHMRSTAPQPTQTSFDTMLKLAVRARVWDGGVARDTPLGDSVAYEATAHAEIGELKAALAILDGGAGHCMCVGDMAIELLGRKGERLAVIGLHHGRTIRWSAWKDDAELLDGERLSNWLAARGITGPQTERLESEHRDEEQRQDWRRWVEAMPECLRLPFIKVSQGVEPFEDLTQFETALAGAYLNSRDRILALLAWFGGGAGPWSGYPAYETVPELLLLRTPLPELFDCVRSVPLTVTQLEGAARFFASAAFERRSEEKDIRDDLAFAFSGLARFVARSDNPADIPAWLKDVLRAHMLDSPDEDNRQTAQVAFSGSDMDC